MVMMLVLKRYIFSALCPYRNSKEAPTKYIVLKVSNINLPNKVYCAFCDIFHLFEHSTFTNNSGNNNDNKMSCRTSPIQSRAWRLMAFNFVTAKNHISVPSKNKKNIKKSHVSSLMTKFHQ